MVSCRLMSYRIVISCAGGKAGAGNLGTGASRRNSYCLSKCLRGPRPPPNKLVVWPVVIDNGQATNVNLAAFWRL